MNRAIPVSLMLCPLILACAPVRSPAPVPDPISASTPSRSARHAHCFQEWAASGARTMLQVDTCEPSLPRCLATHERHAKHLPPKAVDQLMTHCAPRSLVYCYTYPAGGHESGGEESHLITSCHITLKSCQDKQVRHAKDIGVFTACKALYDDDP